MRPSFVVCVVGIVTYVTSSAFWGDLGWWSALPIGCAAILLCAANRLHARDR